MGLYRRSVPGLLDLHRSENVSAPKSYFTQRLESGSLDPMADGVRRPTAPSRTPNRAALPLGRTHSGKKDVRRMTSSFVWRRPDYTRPPAVRQGEKRKMLNKIFLRPLPPRQAHWISARNDALAAARTRRREQSGSGAPRIRNSPRAHRRAVQPGFASDIGHSSF